jgi:hypothetical protein
VAGEISLVVEHDVTQSKNIFHRRRPDLRRKRLDLKDTVEKLDLRGLSWPDWVFSSEA